MSNMQERIKEFKELCNEQSEKVNKLISDAKRYNIIGYNMIEEKLKRIAYTIEIINELKFSNNPQTLFCEICRILYLRIKELNNYCFSYIKTLKNDKSYRLTSILETTNFLNELTSIFDEFVNRLNNLIEDF